MKYRMLQFVRGKIQCVVAGNPKSSPIFPFAFSLSDSYSPLRRSRGILEHRFQNDISYTGNQYQNRLSRNISDISNSEFISLYSTIYFVSSHYLRYPSKNFSTCFPDANIRIKISIQKGIIEIKNRTKNCKSIEIIEKSRNVSVLMKWINWPSEQNGPCKEHDSMENGNGHCIRN